MRMRSWVLGACGALVVAGGVAGPAGAVPEPEADLSLHGNAVMTGDRVEVSLSPRNDGPAAAPDASVLLRWSVPLAQTQQLPPRCARTDERTVVCGIGALGVDEVGERLTVAVRLQGRPSEVTLEVDTAWLGGAVDQDRTNDRLRVLVLDTGDPYAF
ncbi:hypothetical protein [Streptomyces cellostaticus]|uniref:hypothetical protein n=1 Tax=Streptomyces TaxID=1883 RepID=UPI0027E3097C|nr:hypothetical protein [Streptomyces cellostaticus]